MPVGTATLTFDDAGEAQVVVTGQTTLAADADIEAFMMGDSTADHAEDEHIVEPIHLRVGDVIAGTGFTIYAELEHGRADGDYQVRWVWRNP